MANRALTPISSAVSLSHPPSYSGHLPRRRCSSNSSRHSLNFRPNLCCTRMLICIALREEITWRSTVQHYAPLVRIPLLMVIPFLAAKPGASEVRIDSVCIGSRHFMPQFLRLQGKGFSTLLTALILANAFYSDIAPPNAVDTFENVPQELNLSGEDKPRRIQRPKSKKAEACTQKCLGTCIRGGAGSPGEGPFNIRRPLVVFKDGFRSRQYCLIECSEICNIIGDGDDGP